MKKNIIFISLSFIFLVFYAGIYSEIEKEVQKEILETQTITGRPDTKQGAKEYYNQRFIEKCIINKVPVPVSELKNDRKHAAVDFIDQSDNEVMKSSPFYIYDFWARIKIDHGRIIIGPDGTIIEVDGQCNDKRLVWDKNDPNANICPKPRHGKPWGNPQVYSVGNFYG